MTGMWIHCNNCKLKYHPNLKFFLTECGHLKCERCASRMQNGNNMACLVCKSTSQIIRLSNDLKPEIQCFFKSIPESLDQLKEVYMFQDNNTKSFLKSLMIKYDHCKKEVLRLQKTVSDLKKDNINLKSSLEKKSRSNTMSSTPRSEINSSANFSFMSSINPAPSINGNNSINGNQKFAIPGYPKRVTTQLRKYPSNAISLDGSTASSADLNRRSHPSGNAQREIIRTTPVRDSPLPRIHQTRLPPSNNQSADNSQLSSISMRKFGLLVNGRLPSNNNRSRTGGGNLRT